MMLRFFKANAQKNLEMKVACQLCVQKSNIMDTSNIECVWHALCIAYSRDKEVGRFVYGAKLSLLSQ